MAAVTLGSFVPFNFHLWGEMRLDVILVPLVGILCFLMVSQVLYDAMPKLTFRSGSKNRALLIALLRGLVIIAISPATFFFPLCVIFILRGAIISIVRSLRKVIGERYEGAL